ncbi:glycerol-3-phosphate dehydrogenase [Litoribrevibacter albus]|uniref:Glycerol-3-phosphate dehydrogenase n=1 Tax=Litoribrevibacter albus TaxID=1473156 RepID=A0AA37W8M6_9GAMM|nr:glycerol-3-phosphate dehydrogenase [Litoribrevibacter albus]GLQ32668.1 glycerol-3-phosphate dehydrogenase [Litoribrevibacter albus]
MNTQTFDLVIVGGGINGAGIAADAAGRGLSVYLCEQKDFASATSSASSKLIHGGLRYLEHYEFRLVKEALKEREVLLEIAPHLVKPMRFILPHQPHLRPAWMIRSGLFLYDHLGKREKLQGSHKVKFRGESSLDDKIKKGFEYADCWVDDARLVITNLLSAQENGAVIRNHTKCIDAKREDGYWHCVMEDTPFGGGERKRYTVKAKALVNAAGPWVASFIKDQVETKSPYGIRLIKGSHIVVPRIHKGDEAFILQNEDQRIVFVIPYLEKFSLIGTTDVEYKGDPGKVAISAEEVDYLLTVTNKHFKHQLTPADLIWTYSGVRPLCDDESDNPSAITRDYTLAMTQPESAPLLSVFGGKITTYRKLAEAAMTKLGDYFPEMGEAWTKQKALPGGDFPHGKAQFKLMLEERYPWLRQDTINRYSDAYGTLCMKFLDTVRSPEDMGTHFGNGLYSCEVDYLVRNEWVISAEDLLWRRTKLGLFLDHQQQNHLNYYLEKHYNIAPKFQ